MNETDYINQQAQQFLEKYRAMKGSLHTNGLTFVGNIKGVFFVEQCVLIYPDPRQPEIRAFLEKNGWQFKDLVQFRERFYEAYA